MKPGLPMTVISKWFTCCSLPHEFILLIFSPSYCGGWVQLDGQPAAGWSQPTTICFTMAGIKHLPKFSLSETQQNPFLKYFLPTCYPHCQNKTRAPIQWHSKAISLWRLHSSFPAFRPAILNTICSQSVTKLNAEANHSLFAQQCQSLDQQGW